MGTVPRHSNLERGAVTHEPFEQVCHRWMGLEAWVVQGLGDVDPAPLHTGAHQEGRLIVVLDHALAMLAMPASSQLHQGTRV